MIFVYVFGFFITVFLITYVFDFIFQIILFPLYIKAVQQNLYYKSSTIWSIYDFLQETLEAIRKISVILIIVSFIITLAIVPIVFIRSLYV